MYLTGRCLFLNCGRMAAPTLNVSLHSFSWSEGGRLDVKIVDQIIHRVPWNLPSLPLIFPSLLLHCLMKISTIRCHPHSSMS